MTTTGDMEPLASSGGGTAENEEHDEGDTGAAAYLACPVCRAPIPLPADELPPRLTCGACGAILER